MGPRRYALDKSFELNFRTLNPRIILRKLFKEFCMWLYVCGEMLEKFREDFL